HDDEIERVVVKRQQRKWSDLHLDEDAGVCRRTVRACGVAFVSACEGRITTESNLRRNRTCDCWIIDTYLQYTLAHADGAHRHRLGSEACLGQKDGMVVLGRLGVVT